MMIRRKKINDKNKGKREKKQIIGKEKLVEEKDYANEMRSKQEKGKSNKGK